MLEAMGQSFAGVRAQARRVYTQRWPQSHIHRQLLALPARLRSLIPRVSVHSWARAARSCLRTAPAARVEAVYPLCVLISGLCVAHCRRVLDPLGHVSFQVLSASFVRRCITWVGSASTQRVPSSRGPCALAGGLSSHRSSSATDARWKNICKRVVRLCERCLPFRQAANTKAKNCTSAA